MSGTDRSSSGASALTTLLATVPGADDDPAAAFATAASAYAGTAVSVAVHDGSGDGARDGAGDGVSDGAGWRVVAGPDRLPDGTALPGVLAGAGPPAAATVLRVADHAVVVPAEVAGPGDEPAGPELLRQGCAWLALAGRVRAAAVTADTATAAAGRAAAETAVLREVIGQLLSVRDLDQVLLSIADRTLHLLDADICGVLLREDDVLRMRSCVGHRLVETSRLRMVRGQGVAGLVFLTGEPAKVDDYVVDPTISQDFVSLAEQEETRSALAVPLQLHGEFLGVLEVWRRRASLFSPRDVSRMVALADVATVAIDNARLYDHQAAAVDELRVTRDALEDQVTLLRRSASLQRTLLDVVLDGADLDTVVRAAVRESGLHVAVYGADGRRLAAHPCGVTAVELPRTLRVVARSRRTEVQVADGSTHAAWVHPVVAEGDKAGGVCVLGDGGTWTRVEMVCSQVAMACSLAVLRQRAASRARAEALDHVLWDLLEGPAEHQAAARARAAQMGLALTGAHRVVFGRLENIEQLAAEHGWDTTRTDLVRAEVLRGVRRIDPAVGPLVLAGLRGDWVVAVVGDLDRAAARHLVAVLGAAAAAGCAGLRLTWGVSRCHADPSGLPRAYEEATLALSAAHRLGPQNVFLYEELGIVRLLLGSGEDPDFQAFVDEVTGPLLAYDRENNGALVRTLRAFFEADCSQRAAAERLFVHHKTLRYRLERIKQLTGLDLNRHEDRMRADLALRLRQVGEGSRVSQ